MQTLKTCAVLFGGAGGSRVLAQLGSGLGGTK